jgi:hypothetical protein
VPGGGTEASPTGCDHCPELYNPLNPTSPCEPDDDQDGIANSRDNCPDSVPTTQGPADANGCTGTGATYTLTIGPEGLKLVEKGRRKGIELAWSALISGDAALASALQASVADAR